MKKTVFAAALLSALAAGILSGCTTSAPDPTSAPAASSTPHAASTAIPIIPAGTGIIKATTLTSCDTKPGTVVAKGTITVPKDAAKDPVISISWVNADTSTVFVRGLTTVKTDQKGSPVKWSITETLPPTDAKVSCVMGAVIPG